MKRKIFLLLLIIPLLFITACGKGEVKVEDKKTIEYYDEGYGFKTTFEYDSSLTFKDIEYSDEGKAKELDFESEELKLYFNMYYTDSSKSIAEDVKTSRENKKYYKEFNFNGHESYCYGDYDGSIYLIIKLKEDKNDVEYDLFVSIDSLDNGTVVYDVLTQDTLQKFFNSITFSESKKD